MRRNDERVRVERALRRCTKRNETKTKMSKTKRTQRNETNDETTNAQRIVANANDAMNDDDANDNERDETFVATTHANATTNATNERASIDELMRRLRDASTTRVQRKQIRAMLRRRNVHLSKMNDVDAQRANRRVVRANDDNA